VSCKLLQGKKKRDAKTGGKGYSFASLLKKKKKKEKEGRGWAILRTDRDFGKDFPVKGKSAVLCCRGK